MLPVPIRRLLARLAGRLGTAPLDPALKALVDAEFDPTFYRGRNPDVAKAGLDPLKHFLAYGWREGRDPSAAFSVNDYRELHPDVVAAGENPFLHYLRAGKGEGREVRRQLGFRHDILAKLAPLDARLDAADAGATAYPADSRARLDQALAASRSDGEVVHLTVSHDDFTTHLGGLQLSLRREAQGVAAQGRDHLHLFPANPYPTVRDGRTPDLLGVLWNGAFIGHFDAVEIAEAVAPLAHYPTRTFALHSLLGHTTADVLAVLAAMGLKDGFFWLHDYASLCAGFHLIRNDVTDCGAPPPDSAACAICIYQPHRVRHVAAHMSVFEALSLTVVAPSRSALETWRGASDFPHKTALILPHAKLTKVRPASSAAEGPLRVAYPGFPAPHKGWPIFQTLAARFRDDPRYAFLHVGLGAMGGGVEFHEADGSIPERLEELMIDVAMVWPVCRETFGLIAYEAVAAGAAVLTHEDTGNVADFVRDWAAGPVLEDEAQLTAMFETGQVLDLARSRRNAKAYELEFSALTADLLTKIRPT